MSKSIDLTGQRFGRWTVLSRSGNSPTGATRWRCECECGNRRDVLTRSLRSGRSAQCKDCREAAKQTHGLCGHPLYEVWRDMVRRCTDRRVKSWPAYGGRGITVCDEWLRVECFVEWAKAAGWNSRLTLERIDNDGPYDPSNCTWLPRDMQRYNQRKTLRTSDGRSAALVARQNGIPARTLHYRVKRMGWSPDRAATEPVPSPNDLLNGGIMIQIENISNNTIYARLLATAHNHPDLTDGHQGWVGVHIDGLAYASEAEKLVFARVKLDISVEMFPFVPGNSPRWVEMPGWRFEARDVRAAQALALAAWGKRS